MIWVGIRQEITLLISSWLPFGQNELCSDGNKMHSNLFRSSEKVGSFFEPYMISIHTSGMISNFKFRRRQSEIVLRKGSENLVNHLLLTASPFIQHLLKIRKKGNKIEIFFELLVMKEMMRIVQTDPQWGCGRALINSNSYNFCISCIYCLYFFCSNLCISRFSYWYFFCSNLCIS